MREGKRGRERGSGFWADSCFLTLFFRLTHTHSRSSPSLLVALLEPPQGEACSQLRLVSNPQYRINTTLLRPHHPDHTTFIHSTAPKLPLYFLRPSSLSHTLMALTYLSVWSPYTRQHSHHTRIVWAIPLLPVLILSPSSFSLPRCGGA